MSMASTRASLIGNKNLKVGIKNKFTDMNELKRQNEEKSKEQAKEINTLRDQLKHTTNFI